MNARRTNDQDLLEAPTDSAPVDLVDISPAPAPQPSGWNPRLYGWIYLIFGAVAAATRCINLGYPTDHGTPIFDEKHYVPQAWQMVRSWFGIFLGGIEDNPAYGLIVHPPLGKQITAIGEFMFGYTAVGWRVMSAVCGTLTVLLIMGIVRRLTNSPIAVIAAGVLASLDGVLIVTARSGMLDVYQCTFVVTAAYCLIADWQQMNTRMANLVRRGAATVAQGTSAAAQAAAGIAAKAASAVAEAGASAVVTADAALSPRLGFRWWRFSAGVALGMATGVKWSGLFYMAFFGILCFALDWHRRTVYFPRRASAAPATETSPVDSDGSASLSEGVTIDAPVTVGTNMGATAEAPANAITNATTADATVSTSTNTGATATRRSKAASRRASKYRPHHATTSARPALLATIRRDLIPALMSLVVLPLALYLYSWRAWFADESSVYRHAAQAGLIGEDAWYRNLPDTIASWLYYQDKVMQFHSQLTNANGYHHTWESKPWAWLASVRPILYYTSSEGNTKAVQYLIGIPVVWWLIVPVMLWALWRLVVGREARMAWPVVGFLAGFLPWFADFGRQMYFFYALNLIPFAIVAFAIGLARLTTWRLPVRPTAATPEASAYGTPGRLRGLVRGQLGTLLTCLYLGAVIGFFVYFMPLLYAIPISIDHYNSMMWLPSWK